MPEFYCRSLAGRINALSDLVGYGNVHRWLDEIADGCGGCERASFGTSDGLVRWVTVLGSEGGRTTYASIVTESYGEGAAILRTTYGSIPTYGASGQGLLTWYSRGHGPQAHPRDRHDLFNLLRAPGPTGPVLPSMPCRVHAGVAQDAPAERGAEASR